MSQRGSPIIVWFRRDLRMADNPALWTAAATGRPVIPLYVHDLEGPPRRLGAASAWWLDKSLRSLNDTLGKAGSSLILRRDDSLAALRALIKETGATGVYWNRMYDRESMDRDDAVDKGARGGGRRDPAP